MKRLINVALIGLAAATLWELSRQLRSTSSALDFDDDDVHPARMHTWEGEGGALPTTGAQLGPDPSVPATGTVVRQADPPQSVH